MVVDATAVLDAYLPGVEASAALAAATLLCDFADGLVRLVGPPLLPWEVMAVLRRRAAGRVLSNAQARERWELFEAIDIETLAVPPAAAFELAERAGLSGYDAAYFALALEEGAPLVTEARLVEDLARRRHPALRSLRVLHVSDWPSVRPR